jgi:hypothetical protein
MGNSEFGEGLIYNLVLISKHLGESPNISGAADHVLGMDVPEQFIGTHIHDKVTALRQTILRNRLTLKPTKELLDDIESKVEELAFALDEHLGARPIKTDWN